MVCGMNTVGVVISETEDYKEQEVSSGASNPR